MRGFAEAFTAPKSSDGGFAEAFTALKSSEGTGIVGPVALAPAALSALC